MTAALSLVSRPSPSECASGIVWPAASIVGREVPALLTADADDRHAVRGVLLDELDRLLDSANRQLAELGVVGDARLVDAREAARLDPCIRKVRRSVAPEEEHSSNGWHSPSL